MIFKNYLVLFLFSVFLFFPIENNILLAKEGGAYQEEVEASAKNVREEIDTLFNLAEFRPVYGLNDVISTAKKSNSTYEILSLFDFYVSKFIDEYMPKSEVINENEALNLIIALHGWVYIYEELLGLWNYCYEELHEAEIGSSLIKISSSFGNNINNSIYIKYGAWLKVISEARNISLYTFLKEKEGVKMTTRKGLDSIIIEPFCLHSECPLYDFDDVINSSLAKKAIKHYNGLIKEQLPDEWYYMIREYIIIQDAFFKAKQRIAYIVKYYSKNFDANKNILKKIDSYRKKIDLYFKKLDTLLRIYIFDVPLRSLALYRHLQFTSAKHWLDNDKEMKNAIIEFSKLTSFFKHTTLPITRDEILFINKQFKKEYNDKEYGELIATAKLTKDWFDLFARVKNPEPDRTFE